MRRMLLLLLVTLVSLPSVNAEELSAASLDKRRKALQDLLKEQWDDSLRRAPEYASVLGDRRWNDKSSDLSEKAALEDIAIARKFAKRFDAIDTTGFDEQEKLDKELMLLDLHNTIEDEKFTPWLMPVTQMSGFHLQAAQFPALLTFTSMKDFDDYLTRMHRLPAQFAQLETDMRKGMTKKLMPPKFLLMKVADQADQIAKMDAEKSPFVMPLAKFPSSVSTDDQTRIRNAFMDSIRNEILPAYAKFAKFVREEYAPHGRTEVGVWSLPNGAARYAARIRRSTTTNMTAQEIHDLGLREVARIEGEMLEVAKRLGFNDLPALNKSIEANPELRAKSREQILDLYRHYEDQMYAKLPQLFGRLPKAKLEVIPIEPFREQQAAGADYNTGAPDGSRPGRINVNTYDPPSHKTITFESTAYHEGVPGHHMQLSIQQELPALPDFRKQGGYTAYVEGWALYSERLGKEVGFYENPYNDYGRLQDEMLRAIRLVVDTGLHYKKWNRQQVVDFFHAHSAQDEMDIQNETDRYIVWPGQALGYKIG
ncbi:MAG TPA: DUF885 family protein, partial [Thermoanaerobaculia bacterium]|nr:DUF885 family protein [Thermoanaerobaculia bacterium]